MSTPDTTQQEVNDARQAVQDALNYALERYKEAFAFGEHPTSYAIFARMHTFSARQVSEETPSSKPEIRTVWWERVHADLSILNNQKVIEVTGRKYDGENGHTYGVTTHGKTLFNAASPT